jgi:hypothetical protein
MNLAITQYVFSEYKVGIQNKLENYETDSFIFRIIEKGLECVWARKRKFFRY